MFPEDNGAKGPVPDPRDDVYGLACVAYELFSGKHPFNSNTALEALAAGLRPAPILSLDPRAWSALVSGLALRRDRRTASVSAFLADLGVTGRERLRRTTEADTSVSVSAAPAAAVRDYDADWGDLSDKTLETVSVKRPRARASVDPPNMSGPNTSAPDIEPRYDPYRARGYEQRPTSGRRWLPWAAVLAIGGAVYWNYAWLQERGPEWLAMGREVIGKAVQGNQDAVPRDVPNVPTASSDAVPPSATPSLANPALPAGGPDRVNGNASPPPRDSSVAPKDSSAPAKEASPMPRDANAQPPATTPATGTSSSPPTQVQHAAIAGEPVPAEIFQPEKAVVVVSEAAPSAAITIRRHGSLDAATSFVWWTSDGTAVSDEDYINLGARIEKLAAGEQTRTIYVPIVHDSKPEGRESFYVNVRAGQGGKRQDPAERVEVVIEDDD